MIGALCLPLCLPAQQSRVTIPPPEQITAKRGTTITHSLKLEIQPGYHINTNHPKDEFLIPLSVTWSQGSLEPKLISYPPGEEIQVGKDMARVFTNQVNVKTEFAVSSNAAPGPALMTGKVHYQACNNQMCFRPATVEVRLPVLIQ